MAMNTASISVLAMALALGVMTPAEADEWQGAYLTFGLSSARIEQHPHVDTKHFGSADQEFGPYLALGYDWSFGDISLGALFDVEMTGGRDDLFMQGKGLVQESDWFATLRGRVGVPLNDQVRVFASAGMASMRVRSTVVAAMMDTENQTANGFATGLGLEYQIAPGRHLTIEYLHAGFDRTEFEGSAAIVDPNVDALRLGYTIRF
jgi:opacity protein-like surface antigen